MKISIFNDNLLGVVKGDRVTDVSKQLVGIKLTQMLPYKDRRTDHEAELGYVVGKKAKNVKAEDAKDYIFGYFALLDISIRGNEERTWRKSFDTFTPIGPWIVTADEIEDPNDLAMTLWVNDEVRQEGSK